MIDKLLIKVKSGEQIKFKWNKIDFEVSHSAKTVKVWRNYDTNDKFLFFADLENIEYVMRITEP